MGTVKGKNATLIKGDQTSRPRFCYPVVCAVLPLLH